LGLYLYPRPPTNFSDEAEIKAIGKSLAADKAGLSGRK